VLSQVVVVVTGAFLLLVGVWRTGRKVKTATTLKM
jgi:hypothetical protein